ncbi:putative galactose mutarotase-like domain superfamily [Helianthus annuus]|nr:putative galactose mutarotase-like domain superfamily [Helianthus annuus]
MGAQKDDIEIGTGNLELIYSGSEGKLSHYFSSRSAIDASLKQSYSFYAGFDGTTGLQASGAYISDQVVHILLAHRSRYKISSNKRVV